eukprot:gene4338-6140_t
MKKIQQDFCINFLNFSPFHSLVPGINGQVSVYMLILGFLNAIMSLLTIAWIKSQEFEAQEGKDEAVKSVIFPVFVNVLWLSVVCNIYAAFVTTIVPLDPVNENTYLASVSYALMWSGQHIVLEGIAFLLLQKGCGKHAAKTVSYMLIPWAIITFIIQFFIFFKGGFVADWLGLTWDLIVFFFYILLWMAPQKKFFRRPAALFYAKFWTCYKLIEIIATILFFFKETLNIGACLYLFADLAIFALVQPLVCYWTLLQDSRWWQGIEINRGSIGNASIEDLRSPLMGADFSVRSAQSLAHTMDLMRIQGRVRMLNFACIKLDKHNYLGSGSFSKVYKGSYRGKVCAIKMIYTVDLTADIIKRVAAEASILSAIRHRNVVNILGVTVLPPSVCLLLELCAFGSLSDIIRGYGFDWNITHRSPLNLTQHDKLFLALGCARGVAAVHEYDATICHRDIKSFNFLVDHELNVKIADLELGITTGHDRFSIYSVDSTSSTPIDGSDFDNNGSGRSSREIDPEIIVPEDFLANWMAPEVLMNYKFEQSSDVYSLAIVLWEIISGMLPFDGLTQREIRQKIIDGFRHSIPLLYENTPIGLLIETAWSQDPMHRPKAIDIVLVLENILNGQCYDIIRNIEEVPKTKSLVEYYERHYRHSNQSFIFDEGIEYKNNQPNNSFRIFRSYLRSPYTKLSTNDDNNLIENNNTNSFYRKSKVSSISSDYFYPKNNSNNNKSKTNKLINPLPKAALDAIGIIKEESYWKDLQKSGEPWIIVTIEPPHVILARTDAWNHLFGKSSIIQSSFSNNNNNNNNNKFELESLVSLLEYSPSMNQHNMSKSNEYVTSYGTYRSSSIKSVLDSLSVCQQTHGILTFYVERNLNYHILNDNINNNNSIEASSSSLHTIGKYNSRTSSNASSNSSSFASPRSSISNPPLLPLPSVINSSSVSVPSISSTSPTWHHLMCSIHAYPIYQYSPQQRPLHATGTGEIDDNNINIIPTSSIDYDNNKAMDTNDKNNLFKKESNSNKNSNEKDYNIIQNIFSQSASTTSSLLSQSYLSERDDGIISHNNNNNSNNKNNTKRKDNYSQSSTNSSILSNDPIYFAISFNELKELTQAQGPGLGGANVSGIYGSNDRYRSYGSGSSIKQFFSQSMDSIGKYFSNQKFDNNNNNNYDDESIDENDNNNDNKVISTIINEGIQ